MIGRPLDLLRLSRLHTGAVTASVPSLAAIVCGADTLQVVLIFSAALMHHAWGFSLNEIMDLDIDRKAENLSHKPLVSGQMTLKSAWSASIIFLLLSLLMMSYAALNGEGNVLLSLVLLFLSTLSGTAYNLLGKRMIFSDVFVGAWFGLLILSSAAAVGIPSSVLPIAVLIAAVSGIHLLFNNMIEGGMKDADNDRLSSVRSFAVLSGVRSERGKFFLPGAFMFAGIALRFAFIAGVLALSMLTAKEYGNYDIMPFVVILSIAVFAQSTSFLRGKLKRSRGGLLKIFAYHEILSYSLSVLALWAAIGPLISVLAVTLPLLWFLSFNRLMYRRAMIPGV